MDKIETIELAARRIKLLKATTACKKDMYREGKLKGLCFPPFSSLDRHDRTVDIPYEYSDKLRRVIYDFLTAEENALTKEIEALTIQ